MAVGKREVNEQQKTPKIMKKYTKASEQFQNPKRKIICN